MDCLDKHLHGLLQQIQLPQYNPIPEAQTELFNDHNTAGKERKSALKEMFSQVEGEPVQLSRDMLLTELHPQFS